MRKTTSSASGASTPTAPPCRAEELLTLLLTNRKRPPSKPSRKEATRNERHLHAVFRTRAESTSRGFRFSSLRIRAEYSCTRGRRRGRRGPPFSLRRTTRTGKQRLG